MVKIEKIVTALTLVTVLATASAASAQTPQQALTPPLNQPPATACPDLENQQREIRYKLDHTGYGDERDQLVTQLNEVEYHVRVDCFGQ
jgi:hypothetical protein